MDIMLELSRKCNIRCDHCLRGTAKNQVMSQEIIYETIQQAKDNGLTQLTVGGGEPSLATEQLHQMMDAIEEIGYEFETFWLVTNRKSMSDNFILFLSRLNNYVADGYGEYFYTIAYSDDQFHNNDIDPRWNDIKYAIEGEPLLLEEFPYTEDDFDTEELYYDDYQTWCDDNYIWLDNLTVTGHGPGSYDSLLSMGFASEELMCGSEENIELYNAQETNYVAVNGDIFPSCNLSYKVMGRSQTLCKGNILNGDIGQFNEDYVNKWFEDEDLIYGISEEMYELDPELIYEKDE